MDRDKAFEVVRDIIINSEPDQASDITLDKRFIDDLGFDSLDVVQMFIDLEHKLGVELNENSIKFSTVTVGDVVKLLEYQVITQ